MIYCSSDPGAGSGAIGTYYCVTLNGDSCCEKKINETCIIFTLHRCIIMSDGGLFYFSVLYAAALFRYIYYVDFLFCYSVSVKRTFMEVTHYISFDFRPSFSLFFGLLMHTC